MLHYNKTVMQIQMFVSGLTIDSGNNTPIVVLREIEGGRVLPIWIGVIEASAIAFELEKVKLARPMTHDLLRAAIEVLGASIGHVSIVALRDNTYYASLTLTAGGRVIEIDARPSDAIALALRCGARIYCASEVLEHIQGGQDSLLHADGFSTGPAGDAIEEGAAVVRGTLEADVGDEDRGVDGPRPIVGLGSRSWLEVLESLEPKDFGKYKM